MRGIKGVELKTKKTEIVSLFSGAGGLDLGFRQANFRTCLAIDNCESAVQSFNLNTREKTAKVADLSRLRPKDLVNDIRACTTDRPSGVIGGPPCQGFSVGNVSANPSDPRNQLPYRYIDLLKALDREFEIDFFVFENVPGLKRAKHIARFNRIKNKFSKLGFDVHEKEVDAVDFSVAQNRRRLFLVGLNKRLFNSDEFSFPKPHRKPKVLSDVISGLPDPVFCRSGLLPSEIPHHPNHWTMQPKSKKFALNDFGTGRSFRKLAWDKPSHTVAYGNREIHIHPNGKRRLTIFEAMLLQGFPFRYKLVGTFSKQVQQVSNAVPPPVAKAIGRAIAKHIRVSQG